MRVERSFYLFLLLVVISSSLVTAQTTSIKLPTNDDTSAFKVQRSDGTSVIEAAGDGSVTVPGTLHAQDIEGDVSVDGSLNITGALNVPDIESDVAVDGSITATGPVSATTFIGDGSTLSNVVPRIAYTQGDHNFWFPDTQFHNVRSVSITVPGPGVIWVNATGFLDWESKGWDLFYGAIMQAPNNPDTYPGSSELYRYMVIVTDFACADSSDQFSGLNMSRNFIVNSAGTYTYNVWGSKYSSSALTRVHDIVMTAMYFPTGGAGAGKAVLPMDTPMVEPNRNSIDGH